MKELSKDEIALLQMPCSQLCKKDGTLFFDAHILAHIQAIYPEAYNLLGLVGSLEAFPSALEGSADLFASLKAEYAAVQCLYENVSSRQFPLGATEPDGVEELGKAAGTIIQQREHMKRRNERGQA